jgi:RNA polymerase primary sigma factor
MTANTSLNVLMRQTIKHSLLPPEEVNELLRKAKKGDKNAVEKIRKHNQRIIYTIAKKYYSKNPVPSIELCDLVQLGNIGLLKAIDMWKEGMGAVFTTYAYNWIRMIIRRELIHHASTLSVSYQMSEKIVHVRQAIAKYNNEYSKRPSIAELSKMTGYSEDDVKNAIFAIHTPVELDREIENEEGDDMDPIIADLESDTEEQAIIKALVEQQVSKLPENMKTIICHLYGFGDYKILTERELAQEFNVTRQVINTTKNQALKLMREKIEEDLEIINDKNLQSES